MTEPARFDTIRTDRLVMRRWLRSDRAPFAALNADPQTMRFFPQTLDQEASNALADRIELLFDQQGYGLWALEVAQDGEFIGFTGLNPGRARGGVRRDRPDRDLVHDCCAQRAVPGRDAATGADRGRQVQPSQGPGGPPGAAARDLPPVAVDARRTFMMAPAWSAGTSTPRRPGRGCRSRRIRFRSPGGRT
jgi:hypothetical protein